VKQKASESDISEASDFVEDGAIIISAKEGDGP